MKRRAERERLCAPFDKVPTKPPSRRACANTVRLGLATTISKISVVGGPVVGEGVDGAAVVGEAVDGAIVGEADVDGAVDGEAVVGGAVVGGAVVGEAVVGGAVVGGAVVGVRTTSIESITTWLTL